MSRTVVKQDDFMTASATADRFRESMGKIGHAMEEMYKQMQLDAGATPPKKKDEDGYDLPVVETDGDRRVKVSFDLHQFNQNEIELDTDGGKLNVTARHEEAGEKGHTYIEYKKTVTLPPGADLSRLKKNLTKQGVLMVEVPMSGAGQGGSRSQFHAVHMEMKYD